MVHIRIAYFTGLRIGEACALTWQDIDLKEPCLTVRRSMRCNASRHKMEIGPAKRKKIRTVDFCGTFAVILRTAKKKLVDTDDFHFHQLRHIYTINLLSGVAAPKEVQELFGHADVSTTMNIYAHATKEAKRISARLLDKVVGTV